MEILILTANMESYRAAYYQRDFLRELAKQAECYFYGPGYPGFRVGKSIEEILEQTGGRPSLIFTGHSFLSDSPSGPITTFSSPNLREAGLPIVGFINKEYVRLEEKLQYFANSGHSIVFSHHHSIEDFSSGLPFKSIFSPFGVDLDRFERGPLNRSFDLGFSGLLRNKRARDVQPATREELYRDLYLCVGGFRIVKRWKHRNLRILWRSWTGNRWHDELNKRFFRNGKLSTDAYVAAIKNSLVWLNAPSPMGIVSTRYFECMASGTLILTQQSPGLQYVLPRVLYRTFRDTSDFFNTLEEALSDRGSLEATADAAYKWVSNFGTWRFRVKQVLEDIERSL